MVTDLTRMIRLRPQRDGASPGFTLVELMVVLVVIGIVTAAVLPEMRGTYEGALLRSTSRQLVDMIHLANSRAISMRQPHRVTFDRSRGKVFLEKEARVRGGGSRFALAREVPGCEAQLDTRIMLGFHRDADSASGDEPDKSSTASSNEILFNPDGTAEGMDLELTDRQGFRLRLRLNPVTAQVRVLEAKK